MKLNPVNLFFQLMNAKTMIKELLKPDAPKIDLTDIFSSSNDIINFDTNDQDILENKEFVIAWGLARKKSEETLLLIEALFSIKKKYNISDFDFALIMEGVDGENLFGKE